ncbi:DUF6207 family protein, partial [Streptomyces canarius]|uniref:DUF6207 family protein n=1 Tax=Streptomyces canarius TaxID=285453 RepID=UPI001E332BCD
MAYGFEEGRCLAPPTPHRLPGSVRGRLLPPCLRHSFSLAVPGLAVVEVAATDDATAVAIQELL